MSTQAAAARAPAGHYRWMIIGLLFVITTINYMDRNLLGVLKPTIQGDLHFSETEYGNIVFAFSMAYAAGYASMGAFTDKMGVRIGLAVAAMVWCAASTAHGLVTSVAGFKLARIVLGLGEGGNFSDLHQVGGNVVPSAGPGAGDRDIQFRQQYRRACRTAGRRVRDRAVGLADGVLCDRAGRVRMGGVLAGDVPRT